MKTFEISCRKVKISISPWGGNFQFSARGERCVYLKSHPGGEFQLAYEIECSEYISVFLQFPLNVPCSFKSANRTCNRRL